MTLYKWDRTTPANNATADSTINWAEGQAPSSVNDSARGMMTATAKYRDDVAGTITTGGTSTAYTFTSNQVFDTLAHMNGAQIALVPHTNCGATVTLNVDSLGAKPLRTAPGVELSANALIAGTVYLATYNNSSAVWYLNGVYNIAAAPGSITGSMIASGTIAYSNIQNVTNARLLGNFTGGAAPPSELALAGGLSATSTTLTGSLATQGAFKNLSIKVLTNTTVAVAADYVVMFDGTNTRTVAISATCNLGSAGAVNTLDAGSIAIDTWYFIWAISNGSTDGTLASTSSTAPTMPSGYTFKARVGAVQTIHATATLYGTWQLGRKAQYVVGLANTANLPQIVTGTVGSPTLPTFVAQTVAGNGFFVPTTASVIRLALQTVSGGGRVIVAPNASYGAATSTTNPAPLAINDSGSFSFNVGRTVMADILLEATTLQYAATTTGGNTLWCVGWEDNL